MKVKEIMTKDPVFCTPEGKLQDVAKLMCDKNVGEIPVVDSRQSMKPVGVVTDRDIACRAVAQGKDARTLKASDCMSGPAVTVTPDSDFDEACELMQDKQIRRVPVVDAQGKLCGIVAQADVARRAPQKAGEVVRQVSQANA
jgi:CBS domain-containing protein